MLVMRLKEPGGPDAFEAGRSAVPEPSAEEFQVRVKPCGVCGHDAPARQGKLSVGMGDVLGHELAGVVESDGSEELANWRGQRVALVQRRRCGACSDPLAGKDAGLVIHKELQALGSAHSTLEDLAGLVGKLEAGKIQSVVAQTFKLTEASQAHTTLEHDPSSGEG